MRAPRRCGTSAAALAYARAHRARGGEELRELVRFPSVGARPRHAPEVRRCAEWLAEHLPGIGLRAVPVRTSGHPHVLAERGEGLGAGVAVIPDTRMRSAEIPVVSALVELGIPTLLVGFARPDDRIHAPNEKFHLPNLFRGIEAPVRLLARLGAGGGVRRAGPSTSGQPARLP